MQVAFSQRRKLLPHTLGRWLDARGYAGAFDVQRRAEEVPVAHYLALAQGLCGVGVVRSGPGAVLMFLRIIGVQPRIRS